MARKRTRTTDVDDIAPPTPPSAAASKRAAKESSSTAHTPKVTETVAENSKQTSTGTKSTAAKMLNFPAYVTSEIKKRALLALDYAQETLHRWAVRRIDFAQLTWGPSKDAPSEGVGKILYHADQPLNGLFLGVIQEKSFARDDGTWPSRIGIRVVPIDPEDSRIVQRMVTKFARPPTELKIVNDSTYFGSWRTVWNDGNNNAPNTPFTAIFDATERFASREKLEPVPHDELNPGDLVWVEFKVVRYKETAPRDPDEEAPKKRVKSNDWSSWRCAIDLTDIFLLQSGPGHYIDQSDAGAEEF